MTGRPDEPLLASLSTLVSANLLRCADSAGICSYRQLVTLRAYAQEQLLAEGELEVARRWLADYVMGSVEQLSPTSVNVQTARVNQLLREHDNLRVVLDWLLERGEFLTGLHLAARLRRFWEARGLAAEGTTWLERLLSRVEPPGTPEELDAQAEAWKVLVVLSHRLGRVSSHRRARRACAGVDGRAGRSSQSGEGTALLGQFAGGSVRQVRAGGGSAA